MRNGVACNQSMARRVFVQACDSVVIRAAVVGAVRIDGRSVFTIIRLARKMRASNAAFRIPSASHEAAADSPSKKYS